MSYKNQLGDVQTGSTGQDVIQVQTLLTQRGYAPGPIDGIFGETTKTAVSRFQSDRGLVIDGIVGPLTLAALTGASAGPPIPPPSAVPIVQTVTLPTTVNLPPGAIAKITAGMSPATIVIAGLGLITLVTMMGGKKK